MKPAPGYVTPSCECDPQQAATHTVYNELNTMTFLCDRCAAELIREGDDSDLILVAGVELTDQERDHALTYWNLLANGAYR